MAGDATTGMPASVHRARLADHWALVLAYGLVTFALGVILAVWPGETLAVLAVLIAIQLLVSGAFRIVAAIASTSVDGGLRVLGGITGALAVIVGLLCLRDPLQTLLVIGIVIGAWWVASGVLDIIGAFVYEAGERRWWDVVSGLVSVLAGGFLLVHPDLSLKILVIVVCVWLLAVGLIAIFTAFRLRADRTREPAPGEVAAVPVTPPPPTPAV